MDLASLRKVVRWERLPPPPPEGSGPQRLRRGWLRQLFAAEPLPQDPAPAPRARRSGPAVLFAPEHLPLDPPGAPRRRRSRWLLWLLSAEKLDP